MKAVGSVLGLRTLSLALLAMAAALGAPAAAAELVQPAGLVREAVALPFRQSDGRSLKLDAVVIRPAEGRHPLVLVNHGSPRSAQARVNSASSLTANAIAFARRGWAVGLIARRGYGHSEGQFAEGYGGCEQPNYEGAGLASAQDIIQSARFLQSQPYVDPDRVLLVGVSAGGFGSIASASLAPHGLAGVINFAGGRGSQSSDTVCREDVLIRAYGSFGKKVRAPTLWVYAENDHFFGPVLARAMFAAFTGAGAPGELIIAPTFGTDGHGLFSSAGIPQWSDLVDDFLRKRRLPTWARPIAPPLPNLPAPDGASADVVKEFQRYLASQNYEKAFALGGTHFTWVSGRPSAQEAIADAVRDCGKTCRPYAINDKLAPTARASD
jgi:dienelactone hydrolase